MKKFMTAKEKFGEFVESFDCDWAKFILSLDGANTKKLTDYIFKV